MDFYSCTKSKKCCESIKKLSTKVLKIGNDWVEDEAKFYNSFYLKYFIPDFCTFILSRDDEPEPQKIIAQNIFHMSFEGLHIRYIFFRFKFLLQYQDFCDNKYFNLRRIFDDDLEYFIFPHGELEKYLKILNKISTAPLNKALLKKFKSAQAMFKRIMEVNDKDDDEEWLQRIQEWNDQEFISHSIEQRLSKNACNKRLWKRYIEFLRPRNFKAMLGVYCRYCGYFLDDLETKDEYLNEAKKAGINIPDGHLLDFAEFASIKVSKENSEKKSPITKLNLDSQKRQNLAFPNPIVNYLMKKDQILHKLFSTCKFFFQKQPTPICHRLLIAEGFSDNFINLKSMIKNQALTIFNITPKLKEFKNLYVTNYLQITATYDHNLVEEIIPCIYKCAVKYLTIERHQISLTDYIFLTESKTVEELEFHNVEIFTENGALAQLEDIMETLPNVHQFNIDTDIPFNTTTVEINFQSFQKIANFPRKKIFTWFSIGLCNEIFDSSSFVKFLTKNTNKDSYFRLKFQKHIDVELIQQFSNIIENQIIPKRVQAYLNQVKIGNYFSPFC